MLWQELRKIWKPWKVLLMILLAVVYYSMFGEFYVFHKQASLDPFRAAGLKVAEEMVEKYGNLISPEEMAQVREDFVELCEKAGDYVRESDFGKKYGLESYEDFLAFREEMFQEAVSGGADENERYADYSVFLNYLEGDATDGIICRIQETEYYIESYEAEQDRVELIRTWQGSVEGLSAAEFEHARKVFYGEDDLWQNLLPWTVKWLTSEYAKWFFIWICVGECLFLSPLLVQDNMSRMQQTQYAGRVGRRLLGIQKRAVMLSAFLFTTVNAAVFWGMFGSEGIRAFGECRMYSFCNGMFCSWVNWTYGVWCAALIGLTYVMAMGVAALCFFLSRYSTNYVGMLLKMIPLAVAAAFLGVKILEYPFYFSNPIYKVTGIPFIEVVAAAGMAVLGAVLCDMAVRKIRRADVTG